MQPQDASGGGFDWWHVVTGLVSGLFGAASGLIAGVWRVARIEPALRSDFERELNAAEQRIEDKVELLVGQFQETFAGLRQKINDVELETQKGFVPKPDFDDFRREYREDMRDLKASISDLSRKH